GLLASLGKVFGGYLAEKLKPK
uniref:Dahlein-5.6 n=1 Tax=Ranoidea dahlii TaxID=299727 RepID=DAH56_RANDH|nr:RecName: Full=Dahlein-5.6 [Ranoidea dahlii]